MATFIPLAQQMQTWELLLAALILIGLTGAIFKFIEHARKASVEKELAASRAAAKAEGEKILAQAEVHAKNQLIEMRKQFDSETDQARQQLRTEEKRISKREDLIDQKMETIATKERTVETAQQAVAERETSLAQKDHELMQEYIRDKKISK